MNREGSPAAAGEKSGEKTEQERAVIKRGAARIKAALEAARKGQTGDD